MLHIFIVLSIIVSVR